MSGRPIAERRDKLVLRARDIYDGMPVSYDGQDWRVWSKAGPRAGSAWLMRIDPDTGKTITVEARYARLRHA